MLPTSQHLELEQDGPWLTVWFNEPEKRNPLTNDRVEALIELCSALQTAPFRGVTFRGSGGIFCAGGDLKSFKTVFQGGATKDDVVALSLRAADLFDAVAALPQFTVMAVEGAVMAGGFGLACIGDMVIAAQGTKFSLSETRIGLTPAQIAPFVVARLGMPAARRMMLTGAMLDTDAAQAVGLVDQVTDDMDAALTAQHKKVLAAAPQALATIKRQLAALPFQTRDEQRQMAADTFADRMLSDEAREGISAFFDKRKPNWAGG
ncbi:enoyl-CoA hydratase/isomerase family protein [Falsiruegeria mediterranea]|uniref:Putative polyketide biosynthesis enoyl-CoA hydratase PksH n=1 Tax=Falsiruegeria mediterranea M17 TaxID=1200281 RepID=A0A2R8C6H5_9RHOB|nr:enoyl-CoA hydratase-related protein [Falsiruegeria mediterranea]SPJ28037.1 putative polyketide biosynthesis enoyl-CoA hydratase PksH [Falsiruegeria mediterranea M17]